MKRPNPVVDAVRRIDRQSYHEVAIIVTLHRDGSPSALTDLLPAP